MNVLLDSCRNVLPSVGQRYRVFVEGPGPVAATLTGTVIGVRELYDDSIEVLLDTGRLLVDRNHWYVGPAETAHELVTVTGSERLLPATAIPAHAWFAPID